MKRTLASTLGATLIVTLAASASAFAGGIGRAGTYGPQGDTQPATQTTAQVEQVQSVDNSAPKTRAQVKAEIVEAYRNGTLPALNKTSYPNQSLIGRTQAERIALQENRANETTRVARAGE
ncbi:hypothetical protein F4827_001978 [Paraburkholderia bannensis]|uniref:DUF4148 domain-containing protein n=1 Tax=Paraburkholderia bannensis TaxID=765414 RepID=A0A7W9TXQ5_9BURK|nr:MULTISPECIES: DUF4148 domain-containing protein [Paraburkholderia]MBB3261556.1 hypothetical protein [Paraburkholderia sp. WP4_3_2]MBB6102130.1 hypothetical protein [Paraburkholderia bannensis]